MREKGCLIKLMTQPFSLLFLAALTLFAPLTFAQEAPSAPLPAPEPKEPEKPKAEVSSLKPSDIREFDEQPEKVRQILSYALDLTTQNLGYQYGSANPKNGGMDCSGAVSHILLKNGFSSPRASNTIYLWVEKRGNLHQVADPKSLADPQLAELKPGDILFWEGTYDVGERFPPTSHVMLFLGHRKSNGKPVMVGASSGRYYAGKARHGVSVFDFQLPRKGSKSKFVGYGPPPGLDRQKTVPDSILVSKARVATAIRSSSPEPKPEPKPDSAPPKPPTPPISYESLNLPKAKRILPK